MLVWNKTRNIFYFYGHEITADEYQRILAIIENRPTAPAGYGYRLTHDLDWELYELPVEEIDGERQAIRDRINALEGDM